MANTADDWWIHGLKVCPDLDTVMYTLGDGIDLGRGWGRRDETWSAKEELAAYGVEPTWFGLGDRDIATHLVRTQLIDAGYTLSQVTEALCQRWLAPTWGDRVRLLPMTDDRVETHVAVADPESPSGKPGRALPGVLGPPAGRGRRRDHRGGRARRLLAGARGARRDHRRRPGAAAPVQPGRLRRHHPRRARACATPLRTTAAPVVGLSPIVGGSHVRGMAEQLLATIGVEVSAGGVGRHYGARSAGGVIDGWLVDERDDDEVAAVEQAGIRCAAVPLMMTDHDATASMAAAAIALASG